MKAKINSGHRREVSKAPRPTGPQKPKTRSGFQALAGLNTSGSRREIPHDVRGSSGNTGYQYKLDLANVRARGRKMY